MQWRDRKLIFNYLYGAVKSLVSVDACGNGHLYEIIKEKIKSYNIEKWVKLLGRVPHGSLPYIYNELKLLVIHQIF